MLWIAEVDDIMTTVYSILLALFLVIGIKLCKIREQNRFHYELSPRLILVISYYMYSVAMPISRLFFASREMSYDAEYMMVHALGALGILVGLYVQRYKVNITSNRSPKQTSRIYFPIAAMIIMAMTVGIFVFGVLETLGWNLSAIFTPYGYEASLKIGNEEQTMFGSILWVFAISSTVLAFIGAYNKKNRILILITLFIAGLFGVFFLLRGSRTMVSMMIIPLIGVYFYSKPIKIKYVLLSCLCIYLVAYMVGVVRDVGFAQVRGVSIDIQMFDPLKQECGVNHNVFTKWKEMGKDNSLLLGKSYTIDLLYNMVPSFFWPDRPYGQAVQFALDYFGNSHASELTIAWGFSPVVEALINFGYIGIVPVFAFFSILIALFESWFMRQGAWGIACYVFMIPVMIHWNRLDMGITSKVFIVFLVVSRVFATVMYPRKSNLHRIHSTSPGSPQPYYITDGTLFR